MTSNIAYPQKLELRGMERAVTLVDGVSMKIVHSMLVTGDTPTLQRFLPIALTRAFNLHPKMRVLQVKEEDFIAEIQPPITLHDTSVMNLLRVRQFSESQDTAFSNWQQHAEEECNLVIDRYTQFPFFLSVWIDGAKTQARLMLFSDHYMSDGYSGMVVLNCILEQLSLVANERNNSNTQVEDTQVQEFPLRPSFYDAFLSEMWLSKAITKAFVSLLGMTIFRNRFQHFVPVLPTRSDQHDFVVPPITNSTLASFAQGNPANMRRALESCKIEGVTLAGALVGTMVLAFYHAAKSQAKVALEQPFKLCAEVDYNMRQRVPHPAKENLVGAFIAIGDLDWLASEGVDVDNTRFWDFARRAKREIDAKSKERQRMAEVTIFIDKFINCKLEPSFTDGTNVKNSVDSDANLSNVGRYPFERNFSLDSTDEKRQLLVRSLHVYNPIPHLGPSAIFFISSVESFCYSMGHKCENDAAKSLFSSWVELCENIGEIGTDTTMARVLEISKL